VSDPNDISVAFWAVWPIVMGALTECLIKGKTDEFWGYIDELRRTCDELLETDDPVAAVMGIWATVEEPKGKRTCENCRYWHFAPSNDTRKLCHNVQSPGWMCLVGAANSCDGHVFRKGDR